MKEKSIQAIAIVPLEGVITENGTHITAKVIGESKKSIEAVVEKINSAGTSIKFTKIEEPNSTQRSTSSFGISDWSKCLWNPQGPKPNWAAPEDPSKN